MGDDIVFETYARTRICLSARLQWCLSPESGKIGAAIRKICWWDFGCLIRLERNVSRFKQVGSNPASSKSDNWGHISAIKLDIFLSQAHKFLLVVLMAPKTASMIQNPSSDLIDLGTHNTTISPVSIFNPTVPPEFSKYVHIWLWSSKERSLKLKVKGIKVSTAFVKLPLEP